MKTSIYSHLCAAALAAFALTVFTACDDYNPEEILKENYGDYEFKFSDKEYQVNVYSRNFNFPFEGGEASTYFYASESWTLNDMPDWLGANATSGDGSLEDQELILTTQENSTSEARTAVIAMVSGKDELLVGSLITVSQNGSQPYIRFADGASDSYTIGREGGTVNVAILTNVENPEKLNTTFSNLAWVQGSDITDGNMSVTVAPNTSTNAREITVIVRCVDRPTSSISFTISQEGSSFGINEETVQDIPVTGGTLTVNLTSQSAWRATVPSVCQSWVSVAPASGQAGSSRITITVAANNTSGSRIGYVNIYPEGQPESAGLTVTLNQNGQQLEASETSLSFDAAGSTSQITLNANVDWVISSKPGWITISPNSGTSGERVLQFSATANPGAASRSADVVFSVRGSQASALTIHCGQTGKYSNIPEDAISFGWAASSRTISLNTIGEWQAAPSANWISLSSTSGTGKAQITISVTTNSGSDYRQGTIYVYDLAKPGALPTELIVVQENPYLIIDNTSGTVNATGGTIRLDVYSSVGSTAEAWISESNHTAPSWLSYEMVNEGSQRYYRLSAQPNPSGNDRAALFVINAEQQVNSGSGAIETKRVLYTVRQLGRQLSASVTEISLMPAGGQTQTYTITVDGDYEISKASADFWYILSANKLNNTFNIIATPNTGASVRRGTISIRLLNVPSGESKVLEIPVVQFPEGTNFLPGDFGEEVNWDL